MTHDETHRERPESRAQSGIRQKSAKNKGLRDASPRNQVAEKEGFEPTIPSVTCLEFGGSPLEQEPGYAASVSRMTNTQLIKEGKIKKSNHLQREC